MIEIKNKGKVLLSTEINEGSKRKYTLMGDDYIKLKFSLAIPILFPLGSYVECEYGRFEVTENQNPTYNESTGAYDYELQLDAYYRKWKNKVFKYTPETGGQEAAWNLTATLDVHLEVFLKNLKALGYDYNGVDFTYDITGVEQTAQLVSYDNTNLIDALSQMAETWDVEYWITDNVIYFGRCEDGIYTDFELGKNVKTMKSSSSKATYATRVIAFGSTENLPSNYRSTSNNVIKNGVVETRLMLPEGTPYVDAREDLTQEEAVEIIKTFDIKPQTLGEISEVSTYTDSVENDDGTITTETFYRFKDSGFKFKEDYILEGESLYIVFQTGKLAGMQFYVEFNPNSEDEDTEEGQLWEIVVNEDYGIKLPNETLCPEVGDTYYLYGWDSTKMEDLGLVAKAEQELFEKTQEYVKECSIDPNTYTCDMLSAYSYGEDDDGGLDPNFSKMFEVGNSVKLINPAFFEEGYRLSRIIGIEFSLDKPYDTPSYTVGEKASYSKLGELQDDVDSITYASQTYQQTGGGSVYVIKTNDTTPANNTNVFSALRTKQDFLSKKEDDTASGVITFKNGLKIGNYQTGLLGSGGQITKQGNAELRSLRLWEFLEVPELRYNQVSVYTGISWQTHGAGLIESVTIDEKDGVKLNSGTIKLHLEDGQIGSVAVDDLCMGIFHSYEEENSEEDTDERNMNMTFAGFRTVYFRIEEILDSRNSTFRYTLRGTSDDWPYAYHPQPQMSFACYANPTNTDRQSCIYSTTKYTIGLQNMTTWTYGDANIYKIDGVLEGFSLSGKQFHGTGVVLGNFYYYGTQNFFVNAPLKINIDTQGQTALATSETLKVTCTCQRGYLDVDNSLVDWSITRETAYSEDDAVWNASAKAQAFNGEIEISYDDLGTDSNVYGQSTLFVITAVYDTDKVEADVII